MYNLKLTLLLSCISCMIFAQQKYSVSLQELKTYEGRYEYINGSTLCIAVSPVDTLLYAIINQSRYPLIALDKDIFKNSSGDQVRFLRDSANQILGYTTNKEKFKLISKAVNLPKEMWYPKLSVTGKPYHYSYRKPSMLNDGLLTGSINQSGLDTSLLNNMMNRIVSGKYPGIHSILIIKDSKLVFEEYFYEYTVDSVHQLRSASKSFISALTGLALQKGYIRSKDEAVLSHFPEYLLLNNSPLKHKITVEHLLTNQSGLDYDISNPKAVGNETRMNYSDDWVKYTLDLPIIDTPGGKGMYASGNPIILGRIIEKASGQPLSSFANESLFKPLGIQHYKWNFKPDQSNAEDFCQLYLRPRDMAKFGLMYLDGGKWGQRQVLPASWVQESLRKHSTVQNVSYGYLWWLKYLEKDGVRYNGMAAQGNGGQKIFIFPDHQLVVVTTGGNYNSQSPADELILTYILSSFSKK
jgi:CubicO group peptidase (beta-lactamase class C family)